MRAQGRIVEPAAHTLPPPALSALSLTTRDLARARAFYAKLDFAIVGEWAAGFTIDAGVVQIVVRLDGERQPLGHVEPRLEFRVPRLVERCTRLRDRGLSVDGPHASEAGLCAELTDPDGHAIALHDRPGHEAATG